LFVPATELSETIRSIGEDAIHITAYDLESTLVLRSSMDAMLPALTREITSRGLSEGRIGLEMSFEDGAMGKMGGDFKYPSKPTWDLLAEAFPGVTFIDGTEIVSRLRMVKTKKEIECIKKTIAIAQKGFDSFYSTRSNGMTEAQIGAMIEGVIQSEGTGKNGLTYTRAFASIYSGGRCSEHWTHHAYSSGKVIAQGEMVMVELGSVSDGYWCDLTRCAPAGTASDKMQDALALVIEAQHKGLEAVKIGEPVYSVNNACHGFFKSKGYDETYYRHSCGHGTGFNYHEGPPVHSACGQLMEEGMVLCIEPGLYFPGEFGLRAEDIFVVTAQGAEVLSRHPDRF